MAFAMLTGERAPVVPFLSVRSDRHTTGGLHGASDRLRSELFLGNHELSLLIKQCPCQYRTTAVGTRRLCPDALY